MKLEDPIIQLITTVINNLELKKNKLNKPNCATCE